MSDQHIEVIQQQIGRFETELADLVARVAALEGGPGAETDGPAPDDTEALHLELRHYDRALENLRVEVRRRDAALERLRPLVDGPKTSVGAAATIRTTAPPAPAPRTLVDIAPPPPWEARLPRGSAAHQVFHAATPAPCRAFLFDLPLPPGDRSTPRYWIAQFRALYTASGTDGGELEVHDQDFDLPDGLAAGRSLKRVLVFDRRWQPVSAWYFEPNGAPWHLWVPSDQRRARHHIQMVQELLSHASLPDLPSESGHPSHPLPPVRVQCKEFASRTIDGLAPSAAYPSGARLTHVISNRSQNLDILRFWYDASAAKGVLYVDYQVLKPPLSARDATALLRQVHFAGSQADAHRSKVAWLAIGALGKGHESRTLIPHPR